MDLWSSKRSEEELSNLPISSNRPCRAFQSAEAGFTLIEVTLAILLLSGAMVILLGLQSAVMRRTYIDTQNQRAMMAARQVLSAVEASDLPVDTQETSGSLKEVLSGLIEINAEDEKSLQDFEDLRVHLSVTFWGIPTVNDQAMKRVELTVSWSENPQDSLDVTYFIPNDEEATGEETDPAETDGDR
jgi:type II secretory pathway pseudopilin PulG